MHALVITVGIEADRGDEATAMLNNQVVPDVKAMPGFVSGVWARSEDGTRGHSVAIFDDEANARAALTRAQQGPQQESPVKVLYSELYEVLAQA